VAKKERFEDRVLTFPPGAGPFARAVGQTAKLQPGLVALRVGPLDKAPLWAFLFPPPRSRKDSRGLDAEAARHLGVLATEATFALASAARFPDGLEGSIDPLTDLFDARFLLRTLAHEVKRHDLDNGGRGGPGLAIVVVELDGYPAVLDIHGALIGERLLVEAARILVRAVREVDLVARTGAHRFEIVLLGTDRSGADRTAARLRRVLGGHRFLAREGLDLQLGVTIGMAAYPDDGATADALRASAEAARTAD
jgi:diguanylate cyclase (GGDEF)-like protein